MSKIDRRTLRIILTALHIAAMALFLVSLGRKLGLLQYPRMEMFAWMALFVPAYLLDKRRNGVLLFAGAAAAAVMTVSLLPTVTAMHERVEAVILCAKLAVELLTLLFLAAALSGKWKDTRLYVPAALFLGVLMLFALTPLAVPDEQAHYQTAFALSQRLFFPHQTTVHPAYFDYSGLAGHYNTSAGYLRWVDELFRALPSAEPIGYAPASVTYFPEYLLPALGLALARSLGANFITAFLCGRLCNLLFFIACLALALRLAPEKNKRTLGLIALLPITMQQVASFSYDAFIFGLSLLYLAEFLRAYDGGAWSVRHVLLTALSAVLLAPTRAVYMLLLLLLWLVPRERFGRRGRRALFFVLTLLLCAAVTLFFQRRTLSELSGVSEVKLNWEGQTNYTLGFVLSHPGETAAILWRTLVKYFKFWFLQMHGYTLAGLTVNVHLRIPAVCMLLLLFSVSTRRSENALFNGKERLFFALLLLLSGGMMMGVMLLAWTSDTRDVIEGVQGRYFLPVLPLFYLALENRSLRRWARWEKYYLPVAVYAGAEAVMDLLTYTYFH